MSNRNDADGSPSSRSRHRRGRRVSRLRRKDLDPRATGPDRSNEYGVGGGPKGSSGPPVVALLLRLAQLGVPGAVKGLEQCLDAANDENSKLRCVGAGRVSAAFRLFACRELRIYTQQPLPCDADASADVRATQATAWRNWWRVNGGSFRLPSRAAALDLEAFPMISPITIGTQIAR